LHARFAAKPWYANALMETSSLKRALRKTDLLEAAREAMELEAAAILSASRRLNSGLLAAAEEILRATGALGRAKVVFTGIGKSGHIARKLAATLQSTGTPAVFLHASEAAHGDLGLCQPGDPVVMISKSGTTAELMRLVHHFRDLGSPLIGILGNPMSPLASEMDVTLDASVQREADVDGFTPTASAAVALAVGHALAVALMVARGFTADDFARLHAGGQLGRNLRVRVEEVMHAGPEVAWATPSDALKQVVIEMSVHPLGAACVVSPERNLLGIITDGDLRRALQNHDDIRTLTAADVMTKSPVTIEPGALVHDALSLMEDRPRQISVLPVVDADRRCLGLIRLHDIYQTGSRQD
jgi:arabinose-5-phosphate isomerase